MQTPYWIDGVTLPAFRAADGALRTDAVVVGGGITGATAAYLLKQAGLSVILLERDRCGSGDTAHTSAHVTAVTDATAAADLGFDARLVESAPGVRRPGVRFDHQARFRPMEYLDALLRAIDGDGSHVFEHSGVTTVDDEPLVVHTDKARISTSLVVVATHVPILGKASLAKGTLLQTDLYPYSSYVVSARVPKQSWPDALIFDLSDPYYFFRLDPGDTHDMLIAGGCDHKTGQTTDTHKPLEQLRAVVQQLVPTAEITHQWTGQVIETRDRLPYIGEVAKGQFAITGFGGNGITFGTLGAMMARDHATGRTNPWTGLFDINRTLLTDGLWHYVRENSDYPYHMVRDRVAGADGDDLRSVPPGEGRIIDLRGNRVAAYRRESGTLSLMSPICPHMGCVVNWNAADSTWDCPCHGSRFSPTGRVLRGPAESDLSSHQE